MSEPSGIQVPAEPSFDNAAFQGSLQQLLQDNIGAFVTMEFLIGTSSMVTRQGLLYAVGTSYVVLYDDVNQQYTVCDLFAIKFVTFYLPGYRPGQVTMNVPEEQEAAPDLCRCALRPGSLCPRAAACPEVARRLLPYRTRKAVAANLAAPFFSLPSHSKRKALHRRFAAGIRRLRVVYQWYSWHILRKGWRA